MIYMRLIQELLHDEALRISRDPASMATVLIEVELLICCLLDHALLRVGERHFFITIYGASSPAPTVFRFHRPEIFIFYDCEG